MLSDYQTKKGLLTIINLIKKWSDSGKLKVSTGEVKVNGKIVQKKS